jgi:hypothetical protein
MIFFLRLESISSYAKQLITKRFKSTHAFGVLSGVFKLFWFLRHADVFAVIHGRRDALSGTCLSVSYLIASSHGV